MLGKLRSRLTYANIVSTACLFIVLGGTSYAVATGSIDSREIKNNTVRSKDIRNNSVRGKDVRNGSLLAGDFAPGQLPAGPQGATGPRGPKGDTGENGATNVVVRTLTVTAGVALETAHCDSGERAVGGGVGRSSGSTNSGDVVTHSFPSAGSSPAAPDGATPDGWTSGFVPNTATDVGITFYVVCASP